MRKNNILNSDETLHELIQSLTKDLTDDESIFKLISIEFPVYSLDDQLLI